MISNRITRRGFNKLVGSAIGAECIARVKEARAGGRSKPFTIVFVPDPQWLAGDYPGAGDFTCSVGGTVYSAMIQWAITNRNMVVNGNPLNIKGFVQVGDCSNTVSSSVFDIQQQHAYNAYLLAESANPKMFVVRCVGNHDYQGAGASRSLSNVGFMWKDSTGGLWSPTNVATIYGGGMDLGNGDIAFYGGSLDDAPKTSANSYMKLWIQGMRIGVLALELCPSTTILNRAKAIHDANPDYQWWIITHCYQDTSGARIARGSSFGPNSFTLANDGTSTSGIQIWGGSSLEGGSDGTWGGLIGLDNVSMVRSAHWIDGFATPTGSNWVWQRLVTNNTSGRAVQQIFCDCQGASGTGDTADFCHGSVDPNVIDVAHLCLARIDPIAGTMEEFLVSTNTGLWTGGPTGTGALTRGNASPIQLCSVPMASPAFVFPLPNNLR